MNLNIFHRFFLILGLISYSLISFSFSSMCYDSANVGSIGTGAPCENMLIVDNAMLREAASSSAGGDESFEILGPDNNNYTFEDNIFNIFTGQVTNMTNLFRSTNFNDDIGYWNVSSVTNMSSMFEGATSFNVDLSSWDVSSVTDMSSMFEGATSFNVDLNSWDVSSVTDMSSMFEGATSFEGDLSSWNVSSVADMSSMFEGATSFGGDLSSWNVSSVTNMSSMFKGATSFDGDLRCWNVSVILSEPDNFASDSPLDTNGMKPLWGTNGICIDPPQINIISPTNNSISTNSSQLLEIEVTGLDLDTILYDFNGTNQTYTSAEIIEFGIGNFTLEVFANNTLGNVSYSFITFEITPPPKPPEIEIIAPVNNSKFLYNTSVQLEWRISPSDSQERTCRIFVNSILEDTVSCYQNETNFYDLNMQDRNSIPLEVIIEVEFNSTFSINSTPTIFKSIQNTHILVRKSIEHAGTNVYQTFINVENKIENQDINTQIFEFIDENINVGSISPSYSSLITSVVGLLFRGDLYIFNILLTSSHPTELITNGLTFNNENSTLISQYIIGVSNVQKS
ncbi:MAG: BspA family leucine-rich repeat surface protein [Candidatus Woesearchaeota archaeon]